jgi:hypothetical protein
MVTHHNNQARFVKALTIEGKTANMAAVNILSSTLTTSGMSVTTLPSLTTTEENQWKVWKD